MTRATACLLLLLFLAEPAAAGTVEARWDPVSLDIQNQPRTISHYVLYWGTKPRPAGVRHPSDTSFRYESSAEADQLKIRRELPGGRTYYFAVAAVDRDGNSSDYSAEVSLILPSDPATDGGTPDDSNPPP